MTDYSHQSLNDLVEDMEREQRNVTAFIEMIEKNLAILKANGYWDKNVISNFKSIISYSLRHYKTAQIELKEISEEVKIEVREHHCKRLTRLATVASETNMEIGKIWHQDYEEYGDKDYDNPNFRIVETIYADTRDMAVNLLDMANVSDRLHDYIGKSEIKMKKNNPWISGSFYLLLGIIVITGLAVLSKNVHWTILPMILVGGILIIGIIGTLQLKNDDKLKDESFVTLMVETYKRLPLLKNLINKKDEKE